MKKPTIFLYGLILAALVTILKVLEYRFLIRDLSAEIYAGLVALVFTTLGVWLGLKLIKPKKQPVDLPFPETDKITIKDYGLSDRESEVLQLMAQGLSNQQIADKLFVSLPTIKSHSTNIYSKLGVNKRTQAVHKLQLLRSRD